MNEETPRIPSDLINIIDQINLVGRVYREKLNQWEQVQRKVADTLSPLAEAQNRLEVTLRPIVEAQAHIQNISKTFQDLYGRIAADIFAVSQRAAAFQQQIQEQLAPVSRKLVEYFSQLPERTSRALLILAQHGWFLDPEMESPTLWRLQVAFTTGAVNDAESALIDHFEARVSDIRDNLVSRFPHREKPLRAAFSAHTRQEYELSIPVFLAQADGICQELISAKLFSRTNGVPGTASYVERVAIDTFQGAILSPLRMPLPISASASERGPKFDSLNRHLVLHGESSEYGTRSNSLKAISLLHYVAYVLRDET